MNVSFGNWYNTSGAVVSYERKRPLIFQLRMFYHVKVKSHQLRFNAKIAYYYRNARGAGVDSIAPLIQSSYLVKPNKFVFP